MEIKAPPVLHSYLDGDQNNQTQRFQYVYSHGAHRLRVNIERDSSYDFQSSATVDILTSSGWAELIRFPITNLACHSAPRDLEKFKVKAESDGRYMLTKAIRVLEGRTDITVLF